MRVLFGAALLAASALAGGNSLHAQTAVAPAALAPGEVLLETDAIGTVVRPASHAKLSITLIARGPSPREARAALETSVQQAIDAAGAAGVAAADIRPARSSGPVGFPGNEIADYALTAEMAGQTEPQIHVSSRVMEVIVRDPARAERIRAALEAAGVRSVSQPYYEVADEDAARAAARAEALRRARANADTFAAAGNMRVVRMIRISDRETLDAMQMAMFARMMGRVPAAGSGTDVEIQEHVSVDFALAPR